MISNNWITYFTELRSRVFKSLGAVLCVFLALYYFSPQLYSQFAIPLLKHLNAGSSLIATTMTGTFIAPLKLTFTLSILICVPFILYQLWGFIYPGLYQQEKRWAGFLLFGSILLFYLGLAFAYFVVFPLIIQFLTHIAPSGVTVTPDVNAYLDFSLQLFFAFGFAFEVPIVIILLRVSGLIAIDSLKQKRPYVIVSCFILAMVLTPPDVLSQILLAIPLWLLFELGILIAGIL